MVSGQGGEAKAKRQIPIAPELFTIPTSPSELPHLIGSRCGSCREVMFPKQTICANCGSESMRDIKLSRRGKVYHSTAVWYPPQLYKGPVPYALGQVELPEEVLVPAIFVKDGDVVKEVVEPGTEVELVLEKFGEDAEGNEILTYKFKLL